MSVLERLRGKLSARTSQPVWPICSKCRMQLLPNEVTRLADLHGIGPLGKRKTIPLTGELPPGVRLFEGTECEGCGGIYCVDCHDFATKGPRCPGCGEWRLVPVLRAEA